MGTHANVFVEKEDGTLTGTYCHYDGYLTGVGDALKEISHKDFTKLVRKAQKKGGFRAIAGGVDLLEGGPPCILTSITDDMNCDVEYTYIKCLDEGVDVVIGGRRFRERDDYDGDVIVNPKSANTKKTKVKKKNKK